MFITSHIVREGLGFEASRNGLDIFYREDWGEGWIGLDLKWLEGWRMEGLLDEERKGLRGEE